MPMLPYLDVELPPALVILLAVIFAQLLGALGQQRIQAVLLPAHMRLVHGKQLRAQRRLKAELFRTKQELNQTSSQDHFSKWAKLRRKVDKQLAELDAVNNQLSRAGWSLGVGVKAAMFGLTTLAPFALTTWYSKTPMFYLPPSQGGSEGETWLGPIGWALALAAAPAGSVSAGIWSTICTRVILLLVNALRDVFGPAVSAMAAASSSSTKTTAARNKAPGGGQAAATKKPAAGATTATKPASAASGVATAADPAAAGTARRRTAATATEKQEGAP